MAASAGPRFTVLVFTKTTGFRHASIPQGIAAIETLGAEHDFDVDKTEDAAQFGDANLARYRAVIFLNTTGDILDPDEKAAFERYIRSGGGFVGIHSASDTEYRWPWYGRLVGAWFASHPEIQRASIHITGADHPSTKSLPATWERTDEWYNFRSNPRNAVQVLATLDETTYSGGAMGADHPISWCQQVDSGRSWYTAMGHTKESYAEPLFRLHLLGGIESAAGAAGGCESGAGKRNRGVTPPQRCSAPVNRQRSAVSRRRECA
jgi:cytochrome c